MKIFRKLHINRLELKIRHAMATGVLPTVQRNGTRDAAPKTGAEKPDGNDAGQSR